MRMKDEMKRESFFGVCVVSTLLCVILTTRGRPLQNGKENLKRYWMS